MSLEKKRELRKTVLARRDALSEQDREEKSECIANAVIHMKEFENSTAILLYDSIRSEVKTTAIAQEARRKNKKLYYPRVTGKTMEFYLMDDETEMEIGSYGICEPKLEPLKAYVPKVEDGLLIIIPGVGFDEDGNRIGYGGGYYDKYLATLESVLAKEQISKVALAYECQILKHGIINTERYDKKVNYVITENRQIKVDNISYTC